MFPGDGIGEPVVEVERGAKILSTEFMAFTSAFANERSIEAPENSVNALYFPAWITSGNA